MSGALLRKLPWNYGALPWIYTRHHTQVAHMHSISILEDSFHPSQSKPNLFWDISVLEAENKAAMGLIFTKKTWMVRLGWLSLQQNSRHTTWDGSIVVFVLVPRLGVMRIITTHTHKSTGHIISNVVDDGFKRLSNVSVAELQYFDTSTVLYISPKWYGKVLICFKIFLQFTLCKKHVGFICCFTNRLGVLWKEKHLNLNSSALVCNSEAINPCLYLSQNPGCVLRGPLLPPYQSVPTPPLYLHPAWKKQKEVNRVATSDPMTMTASGWIT